MKTPRGHKSWLYLNDSRAPRKSGHEFNNKVLLRAALTHPSAVEGQPVSASYERLEFLGDSILGAVVARSLFESYPEFDEGKLTRLKVSLVSGATLSEVSHELGIDDIIIFGASETGTGARGLHSALENVYESLVGALYLDAGWDAAAEFIHRTLKPHLASERAEHPANPKSFLQECVQADGHEPPAYKLVGSEGPAHAPTFTAVVLIDGHPPGPRYRFLQEGSRGSRCTRGARPHGLHHQRRDSEQEACLSEEPCISSPSRSKGLSRLPTAPI